MSYDDIVEEHRQLIRSKYSSSYGIGSDWNLDIDPATLIAIPEVVELLDDSVRNGIVVSDEMTRICKGLYYQNMWSSASDIRDAILPEVAQWYRLADACRLVDTLYNITFRKKDSLDYVTAYYDVLDKLSTTRTNDAIANVKDIASGFVKYLEHEGCEVPIVGGAKEVDRLCLQVLGHQVGVYRKVTIEDFPYFKKVNSSGIPVQLGDLVPGGYERPEILAGDVCHIMGDSRMIDSAISDCGLRICSNSLEDNLGGQIYQGTKHVGYIDPILNEGRITDINLAMMIASKIVSNGY